LTMPGADAAVRFSLAAFACSSDNRGLYERWVKHRGHCSPDAL
jgi:hypothetical protein